MVLSAQANSTATLEGEYAAAEEEEEEEEKQEQPWQQKKHRLRHTLTEEEVQAITQHNCSVAYLTFGTGEDVAGEESHCLISLWFTGQYPAWLETPNFVEELERAGQKELMEFTPRVCECGILDIGENCPKDVLEAAQTIIKQCPKDQRVLTNLAREGRTFNPKKREEGKGFTWSIFD
ncbi:uncharacterized protein [Panulirus ornatus]|uniref:uncharacterized protein n=1 Tax=Panulirus ornatus TaxID=150431 RepID=UPI003A8C0256